MKSKYIFENKSSISLVSWRTVHSLTLTSASWIQIGICARAQPLKFWENFYIPYFIHVLLLKLQSIAYHAKKTNLD